MIATLCAIYLVAAIGMPVLAFLGGCFPRFTAFLVLCIFAVSLLSCAL